MHLHHRHMEILFIRLWPIAVPTNTVSPDANAISRCKTNPSNRRNVFAESRRSNRFWLRSNAMEIPYTVSTRPDTGLWNAKIGIWLFLASEVMHFGALFSAYIFLRIDAPPATWPHGLLNVPVGTMNTASLILYSLSVYLATVALPMTSYRAYWWYMLATISCGVIFLVVKLG